jgi:hypothetical protein
VPGAVVHLRTGVSAANTKNTASLMVNVGPRRAAIGPAKLAHGVDAADAGADLRQTCTDGLAGDQGASR